MNLENDLRNTEIIYYVDGFGNPTAIIKNNNSKIAYNANDERVKLIEKQLIENGLGRTNISRPKAGENLSKYIPNRRITLREKFRQLRKKISLKVGAVSLATVMGATVVATNADKLIKAAEQLKSYSISLDDNSYDEQSEVSVDSMSFDEYLEGSSSIRQKEVVSMMSNYTDYFNIDFANTYLEEGKNVKASLNWEYEIPALTIAYNDFSKDEIKEIFNGAEFNAQQLDASYKNATLQLFGAYVISDREKPVAIYDLIESQEGKIFVQNFEDKFYNILEAKNKEEKLERVKEFYQELYKCYPISKDIREVGISHANANDMIDEPYKLAVIPMVIALEVMCQNLDKDFTLPDDIIEYFNDLGLCNYAYSKFEKVASVLYCADSKESYRCFIMLTEKKIGELTELNAYVFDDEQRELTKLDKFQERVNNNWHLCYDDDGKFNGNIAKTYKIGGKAVVITQNITQSRKIKVHYVTKKTIRQTDKFEELVKAVGYAEAIKIVEEVDAEFAKENMKARAEAEAKANAEAGRQQAIEDAKADELKKQVAAENELTKKQIEYINKLLSEGKTINKENLPDNIKIDNDYFDEQGNLKPYVKEITTNPEGKDKLPDPNKTNFDEGKDNSDKGEQDYQVIIVNVPGESDKYDEEVVGYKPDHNSNNKPDHHNDNTNQTQQSSTHEESTSNTSNVEEQVPTNNTQQEPVTEIPVEETDTGEYTIEPVGETEEFVTFENDNDYSEKTETVVENTNTVEQNTGGRQFTLKPQN